MPGGLSDCQERRVRDFLRNVLGPHEQEHARLLQTYDGTTSRAVLRHRLRPVGPRRGRERARSSRCRPTSTTSAPPTRRRSRQRSTRSTSRSTSTASRPGLTPRGRWPCPHLRPLGRAARVSRGSTLATSDADRGGQACRRTCHPVCTWRRSSRAHARSRAWVRRWPPSSGSPRTGPFNQPTLVSNWTAFTDTFGGFVPGSYLAQSVYGYFMNGGGNCYVVRIGQNGTEQHGPRPPRSCRAGPHGAARPA